MPDSLSSASAAAVPFAFPLDDFYARSGLPLPPVERLNGDQVPQPYRSLLVHDNDMTPTLENFHGSHIHLQIINRERRADFYFREVILRLDGSDKAVEFGANKVSLLLFPSRARQLILEERLPLGRILKECQIAHQTRPKAFFKVTADNLIGSMLAVAPGQLLYGRRATIYDPQQRPLSEIVEILPLTTQSAAPHEK